MIPLIIILEGFLKKKTFDLNSYIYFYIFLNKKNKN